MYDSKRTFFPNFLSPLALETLSAETWGIFVAFGILPPARRVRTRLFSKHHYHRASVTLREERLFVALEHGYVLFVLVGPSVERSLPASTSILMRAEVELVASMERKSALRCFSAVTTRAPRYISSNTLFVTANSPSPRDSSLCPVKNLVAETSSVSKLGSNLAALGSGLITVSTIRITLLPETNSDGSQAE